MRRKNIYLVGFMGSGKSAVGRALSRLLRTRFCDLDADIERRAGRPVARIFEDDGEAGFRRLERSALRRSSRLAGWVVALGGGALLDRGNRRLAASTGIVVRLACSEAELWRRLKPHAGKRPLLVSRSPRRRLRELLRERRGAYGGAAITVSTTTRSPEETARLIQARLRGLGVS